MKSGKGMNSVEPEGMDLGGGIEPEAEKSEDGKQENHQKQEGPGYKGKWAPLSWDDQIVNTQWNEPQWGYEDHYGGYYILEKMESTTKESGFTEVKSKKKMKEDKKKEILAVGDLSGEEWMEIEAIVDSGAIDTICPRDMIGDNEIKETEISRRNGKYASADGGAITNLGESKIQAKTPDGTGVGFTTQVGDKIKRMLLAVRRMTESGNMVIFGADMKLIRKMAALDKIEPNVIIGKNGKKSAIIDKDGMYVYPIKIKRKRGKDDMDVGTVTIKTAEDHHNECGICGDDIDEWTPF